MQIVQLFTYSSGRSVKIIIVSEGVQDLNFFFTTYGQW